ncbi:MAG: prenyltransferase/squalene oxidase repeat-containing protein [Thermoguttaceae bacterium]
MAAHAATDQAASTAPSPADQPSELVPLSPFQRARVWLLEEGPWWLCSFVFHLVLVCALALIGGRAVQKLVGEEPPAFEEAKLDPVEELPKVERFDVGKTPYEPSELSTDTLTLEKPGDGAEIDKNYDNDPVFRPEGGGVPSKTNEPNLGGLGMDLTGPGPGPAVKGKGGVGIGIGTGTRPGSGGPGTGFGWRRGTGHATTGATRISERAVAGALNWLARHQSPNGSWSLSNYNAHCKDGTCSGPGRTGNRLSAATALGLLPFLAAGQTHKTKGPYQKNIAAGIRFLVTHQNPDGDMSMGAQLYDHGLAAIALCECYGMSGDAALRPHAQAALNFIVDAQDPKGGGWRYRPRRPGDTSVVGWQLMALKSGQMAYLPVNPAVFDKAKEFLKSVAYGGQYGGIFCYLPGGQSISGDDRATTAIALLCHQYMHMERNNPAMVEGTAFLMQNLPDPERPNLYYWYYATMTMHNQPGKDWDTWNRKIRRLLIDTQSREGCAAGSWYSTNGKDPWAEHGGRVMMTSLAALTLEVYYRYLPLYKVDAELNSDLPLAKPGKAAPGKSKRPDTVPELEEPEGIGP